RSGRRCASVRVEAAELVALAEVARAAVVAGADDQQVAPPGLLLARERGLRGEPVTPLPGAGAIDRGGVGVAVLVGRHVVAGVADLVDVAAGSVLFALAEIGGARPEQVGGEPARGVEGEQRHPVTGVVAQRISLLRIGPEHAPRQQTVAVEVGLGVRDAEIDVGRTVLPAELGKKLAHVGRRLHAIAEPGIRSQFTVSPNGSLMRTPSWYTEIPWGVPSRGEALNPR